MFRPSPKSTTSQLGRRAFISGAAVAAAGVAMRPDAAAADTTASPLSATYSTRGSDKNGVVAIEEDGSEGIVSLSSRTGWTSEPQMRLRISRAAPDSNGAEHMLLLPYQWGMALEYPGVVEYWVTDLSVHGRGTAARLWVGNNDDSGGMLLTATRKGGVRFAEITSQLFTGDTGGDLRFTIRDPGDAFDFRSGPNGQESTALRVTAPGDLEARADSDAQVKLGAVGADDRPGVSFGKQGAVKLWADDADALRTDSMFVAGGGLGLAGATPATDLGSLKSTVEVFDEQGASLGVMPIYEGAVGT